MKKRMLSLLLTVLLLVGCLPVTAMPATAAGSDYTGTGTASDPYLIYTAKGLTDLLCSGVTDNFSKSFKLMKDIDLGCDKDNPWTPIGKGVSGSGGEFVGTFDGNGHEISGMYLASTENVQGLFCVVGPQGVVKNLGLVDSTILCRDVVGSIVGRLDGTLRNCYYIGDVNGHDYGVGGLVGWSTSQGSGQGIISVIENCYHIGNVNGSYECGGIVGQTLCRVSNCFNIGNVSGGNMVGGITGGLGGVKTSAVVENCYNIGDVTGTIRVGGIVGCVSHGGNVSYPPSIVEHCYNLGAVSCTSRPCGGIVGNDYPDDTILRNNYYLKGKAEGGIASDTSSDAGTRDSAGEAEPITEAQLAKQSTFENWDFDSIWIMSPEATDLRPILRPVPEYELSLGKYGGGAGTAGDPYLIKTAGHLKELANTAADWSAHFLLAQDIDLSAVCKEGTSWEPIGAVYYGSFSGVFDGGDHTITGLYIKVNEEHGQGLFGTLRGGTIKNLTVDGDVTSGSYSAGIIVGYLNQGTVENCHSSGSVSGNNRVGGITGWNSDGTVKNCTNSASVSAEYYVGGIMGDNLGLVTNCSNTGNVTVTKSSGSGTVGAGGGITGSNGQGPTTTGLRRGTVENCRNTGDIIAVNGQGCLGGIAGDHRQGGTLQNCYNTGDVTVLPPSSGRSTANAGGIAGESSDIIKNCYNTGNVTATYRAGGITAICYTQAVIENCYNIGKVSDATSSGSIGAAGSADSTITNCYYLDGTAVRGIYGDDTTGRAEVLTYDQFASEANFQNWDFGGVWEMGKTAKGVPVRPVLTSIKEDPLFSISKNPECGCFGSCTCGEHCECTEEKCNCGDCAGNIPESPECGCDENCTCAKGDCYCEEGNCNCKDCPGNLPEPPAGLQQDENGVYLIPNLATLEWFRDAVNGGNGKISGRLTADINLSKKYNAETGESWEPIGIDEIYNGTPFTGTFDGDGHKIIGLYLSASETSEQGLFGRVETNGVVKNVGVVDAYIKGGTLSHVGGVAASVHSATVENCYFDGTITGNTCFYVGGVVGWGEYHSVIKKCWSSGSVTGNSYVGGVVGMLSASSMENCYSTSDVSAGAGKVGGVAGEIINSGTVKNCYSNGEVSIIYYNYSGLGGVAGAASDRKANTVVNCYYLKGAVDGGIDGEDVPGQAEPITVEQFAEQGTFVDWDFTDIWTMNTDENDVRPVLRTNPEPERDVDYPVCGCEGCDGRNCTCTGNCTDGKCECEGCNPKPKCECKNCDSSKCTCTGDCSGSSCKCSGCAGKPSNPNPNPNPNPGPGPNPDPGPGPAPAPEECDGGANCPSRKFTDLDNTKWYHKATDYVINKGLMSGTSATEFSPNTTLTRAMLVTILWRSAGSPKSTLGYNPFKDVPTNQYYYQAVMWAYENNVVAGTTSTTFSPNSPITREQLAAILWRYAGSPSTNGSFAGFTDSGKVSSYAEIALRWALEKGIVSGKGNGILDPGGKSTRAEAASMLMRYLERDTDTNN